MTKSIVPRKLLIAAALACGAAVVTTSAMAEYYLGPERNGDKCYTKSFGYGRDGFGYWGTCPGLASAPAQATRPGVGRSHARRHEASRSVVASHSAVGSNRRIETTGAATPQGTSVVAPTGKLIGADPDPAIRSGIMRDWSVDVSR